MSKVGDYVYKPFKPQKIGKVLEIIKKEDFNSNPKQYGNLVKVHWSDGKIKEETDMYLNNFGRLIADHEKKLATHKATLEKAKMIIG